MPHNTPLISMKRTVEEKKEDKDGSCLGPSNDFPWGLRLDLDKESLDKLNVDLKVGQEVYVSGLAKVVRVSESADEEEERRSAELQVTELALTDVPNPNDSDADIIYKKTK